MELTKVSHQEHSLKLKGEIMAIKEQKFYECPRCWRTFRSNLKECPFCGYIVDNVEDIEEKECFFKKFRKKMVRK